jgi:Bifunctional DNA primase/polymerase, N-terminal
MTPRALAERLRARNRKRTLAGALPSASGQGAQPFNLGRGRWTHSASLLIRRGAPMKSAPSPSEALVQGWSVIPCNKNKKPIVDTWKPFQKRQAKPGEIAQWERNNPATWAIATGAISNRITLDFDGAPGRATCHKLDLRSHHSTPSGGYKTGAR